MPDHSDHSSAGTAPRTGQLSGDLSFSAIANSIDQMIWSTRPDGFHDYYNARWYEYTGVTAGSTDGDGWNGMFHPDDQDRAWKIWRKSLDTGVPYHIEYRLRHRSGDYRWVIGRAQCVRDDEGRIARWYGTCTDIHDLKSAEELIQRNHETFYNLIQNNPFGVYVIDADFRVAEASKGSLKVFENVEDLIGRDFAEVLRIVWAEPFATEVIDRFHHTLDSGEPYISLRMIEHRGDIAVEEAYDWRIERVDLPDGRYGVVCYFYDLSERLEFEHKIQLSEERFRRIFEQTSDLILTADLNQVITDCNPSAAAALGLERHDAIGRNISEFIAPGDFERTIDRREGGTSRFDVQVQSSSDELLLWEINSGRTFDDDGKPMGFHVVGRDVTERKRLERHQQLLVGELNHRVKNTLSIVQSLAHQTFKKDSAAETGIARFEGRLQALAVAHVLLTRKNWESASIDEVLFDALAPFSLGTRFTISGPTLMLPPAAAVALALATHELATNAVKYGALSNDSGRVSIEWAVEDDRMELLWIETGGPPVVATTPQGFGTKLIQRALASDLRGTVELQFNPAGLICRVLAPVPRIE